MKQYQQWIAVAIAVGVFALCGTAAADIPENVDFHATWDDLGSGFEWRIEKDEYNYGLPEWGNPPDNQNNLLVYNEYVPEKVKHVWLEIEWNDNVPDPPTIWIEAGIDTPSGGVQRLPDEYGELYENENLDGYTWYWLLVPQPDWEKLHFPSGIKSDPNLRSIEVGTYCIPEPATVSLLLIGSLMLCVVAVIRRKR